MIVSTLIGHLIKRVVLGLVDPLCSITLSALEYTRFDIHAHTLVGLNIALF